MLNDFKWNPFTDIGILMLLFLFVGVSTVSGLRHDIHIYQDQVSNYIGNEDAELVDVLDVMLITKEYTYNPWDYNRLQGDLDEDIEEVIEKIDRELPELISKSTEDSDELEAIVDEYEKIKSTYIANRDSLKSMGTINRHISERRTYIKVASIYGIMKILVYFYRRLSRNERDRKNN